jgi:Flp pilus assembly protein TadD
VILDNLGNLLYKNGRFDEAVENYAHVVTLNPAHGDAHAKLGNLYLKKGEKNLAISHWEKALALEPQNEILKNNLKFVKGNPA